MKDHIKIVEETGAKYNRIIFEEDYIPQNVYKYQIQLRGHLIDKFIQDKFFEYALDIGCGTGFHLTSIGKHSNNLIGIDMSLGALKEAKKTVECNYLLCDINKLPFKNNTIDFIWIAGVLHHVPDDLDNVMPNISRILRHNGVILIDEPNSFNLFNHINMKLSKADPTGHEHPLPLNMIKNHLELNGLSIIDSNHYELLSPLGILLKNKKLLYFFETIDKYLAKTALSKILLRWYILASKSDSANL
jgi:SAM-dependent methyltransferase